ncbi:MAG: hypothetical protein ABIF19_04490 [Planctomycetota bacterium]
MEFNICVTGNINGHPGSMQTQWLADMDEQEAILEARKYGLSEGMRVALVALERDGVVRMVAGWTRIKGGEVKGLRPEDIQDMFEAVKTSVQLQPGSGGFESWRTHVDEIHV